MKYIKSQNTYFATAKDNPKDRIEVEVGDSKQPDFKPQVKLMRWDNECNVSLRLKHNETSPVVSKQGEKIKWEGNKISADIYALEEGHEFEVILKEKPDTNVIEFTIQDKDVEYFYQPELTPEEITEGASRPDNVVSSYAIYAKTPKINYTGKKEYKCGKVGHIYRPKIVDSTGTEVWGELHIENGILSVTIPQDFLNNAVYPVRHAAGLTFGYTTQGGSSIGIAGARGNVKSTSLYTANTGDIITSYSVIGRYASSDIIDIATYSIVSGGLSSRLDSSVSQITVGTAYNTTYSITGLSINMSNGTTYGIAIGNGKAVNFQGYFDTLTGSIFDRQGTNYTLGSSWSHVDYTSVQYSIYATYTAGGSTSSSISSSPSSSVSPSSSISSSPSSSVSPSTSISSSPSTSISSSSSSSPSSSISPSTSISSSISLSPSTSISSSLSTSPSSSISPSTSISSSISTSPSTSISSSPSTSISSSISSSPSSSISSSESTSPSSSVSPSTSISSSISSSISTSVSSSESTSISSSPSAPVSTTLSTDLWKVTFGEISSISSSISSSESSSPSSSVSPSTSISSSISSSPSTSESSSPSSSESSSPSPSTSISTSPSTSISTSISPSTSISSSVSSSESTSISSSPSTSISSSISSSPSSSESSSISSSESSSPSSSISESISSSLSSSPSTSVSSSLSSSPSSSISSSRSSSISSSASPSAPAGRLYYWTGISWELKPLKYWDGSNWVEKVLKWYNGGWNS